MLINMTLENASIIMVYRKLEETWQLKHVNKMPFTTIIWSKLTPIWPFCKEIWVSTSSWVFYSLFLLEYFKIGSLYTLIKKKRNLNKPYRRALDSNIMWMWEVAYRTMIIKTLHVPLIMSLSRWSNILLTCWRPN